MSSAEQVLDWEFVSHRNVTFIDHPGPMQATFQMGSPDWMFVLLLRDPMTQVLLDDPSARDPYI